MPVESFVMGAEGWTPVGHKATRDDHRMLPVGPIHAAEPQDGTTVCGGIAVQLDREGRSFVAWAAGTCERCSEALAPRPAPTPSDALQLAPSGEATTGVEGAATGPEGAGTRAAPSVDEAAELAADRADAERPIGDARPGRTGPDGEPLGGEGS